MFFRKGEFKDNSVIDIVNSEEKVSKLEKEWESRIRGGSQPLQNTNDFSFDHFSFLYYRARVITADMANLNGDWFDDAELRKAYLTFIGRGIYFNHNSNNPDNAFGIILNAVYTPEFMQVNRPEDKYVEILGAIHRQSCEKKYPGLLRDIENERITSTSMGVLAKSAQCSLCDNTAFDYGSLCEHMDPKSMMYCKGQKFGGRSAFEKNFGLTFIEDSYVYVPADPLSKVLELYRNASAQGLTPLVEHFAKYAKAMGRTIAPETIFITGSEQMQKQAADEINAKNVDDAKPDLPPLVPAESKKQSTTVDPSVTEIKPEKKETSKRIKDLQAALEGIPEMTDQQATKFIVDAIYRIVGEEARKSLAPIMEAAEKHIRSKVSETLPSQVEKVKEDVQAALPGVEIKSENPVAEIAPLDGREDTKELPKTSSWEAVVTESKGEEWSNIVGSK